MRSQQVRQDLLPRGRQMMGQAKDMAGMESIAVAGTRLHLWRSGWGGADASQDAAASMFLTAGPQKSS